MVTAISIQNEALDGVKRKNGFFLAHASGSRLTRGRALQGIERLNRFAKQSDAWFHIAADVNDHHSADYIDITIRTFPSKLGFESKSDFVKSVAGRLGVERKVLDEVDLAFEQYP